MRSIFTLLSISLSIVLLSACVSKKKYTEAINSLATADSVKQVQSVELGSLTATLIALKADTTALGKQLRKVQREYQALEQSATATSSELSAELATKTRELENKKKAMELFAQELQAREAKVNELNALIARKDSANQAIFSKLENALTGFGSEDLRVEKKDGKVYVSLSDQLLFQSGSASVNTKGRQALLKVAEVLNKNPEIDVLVEGHTDNVPIKTASYSDNWDLSVARAVSVVRIMIWGGKVDPKRVIPSGRSQYLPVADNSTKEGKSQNRRTEIILSPRLGKLYDMLEKN